MTDILENYFEALDRLKKGRPNIVSKGSKITNDAVALESGRGKGSIKKSRIIFFDLIQAIDAAAKEQSCPRDVQKERTEKFKIAGERYREWWEEALKREVSLLKEVFALKKELAQLKGQKVLPLRRKGTTDEEERI